MDLLDFDNSFRGRIARSSREMSSRDASTIAVCTAVCTTQCVLLLSTCNVPWRSNYTEGLDAFSPDFSLCTNLYIVPTVWSSVSYCTILTCNPHLIGEVTVRRPRPSCVSPCNHRKRSHTSADNGNRCSCSAYNNHGLCEKLCMPLGIAGQQSDFREPYPLQAND